MSILDKIRGNRAPAQAVGLDAVNRTSVSRMITDKHRPVGTSPDLTRITALPRRDPPDLKSVEGAALVELAVRRWGRGPRECLCQVPKERGGLGRDYCIDTPFAVQAWAMHEASTVAGLAGPITVGGGKCVDASVEFFDYRSGRRRSAAESGEVSVATYSEKRLSVAGATSFASGAKACVRLVLRDGTELIASHDHPILTARGWVPASEILASDFIAQATTMPEPERPTVASDDEVILNALLLSDGCVSQRSTMFTNMTPCVIEEFQRTATSTCSGWSERKQVSRAREFYMLGARTFRDRWGLHGLAKEKRLHADLWGLPRAQVALFVNRFWACDGHVSGRGLEITLASEKMVDDLRFMLVRLGSRSRKRYSPKTLDGAVFPAWTLDIRGADAVAFLAEVGDVLGKEKACQRLREKLASTERNTNTDVVPVGYEQVKEMCDELGLQGRGGDWRARLPGRPRDTILRFLGATDGQLVSRRKFREFCTRWNYTGKYAHLATEDVAWQAVERVEVAGLRPVFDLSVPGTHNFVANGIVVHNTYLDIMLAMAVPGARQVVLLVPPKLRPQLRREYLAVAEHWHVPSMIDGEWRRMIEGRPIVHVVPYSIFSRPESSSLLEKNYRPDLVIADEAHSLRSRDAARTARVLRYWRSRPETRMCWLTGTAVSKSLEDALHLFALALGEGSPLPLDTAVGAEWALAVDPSSYPSPPGALERFGTPVREGIRRRIVETPGVVSSAGASIDTPLRVLEWSPPPLPASVSEALDTLRGEWRRPDTQTLVDDMEVARCALELSAGFFYRWRFPRGESRELIEEWFAARKEWGAELRDKVKCRRAELDSPHLCTEAARRAHGDIPQDERLPSWLADSWPRWRDVKDLVEPVTGDPVWIDDWFAQAVAEWARPRRAVVWYQFGAFGRRVAEILGVPLQSGGPKADERITAERGDRSIVASLKSHGTGRDGLQRLFSECMLANPPSSGQTVEQVLGRLHRPGQRAAEVVAWIPRHTAEVRKAVRNACERSNFIDQILHPGQKLSGASASFLPCDESEADTG